MQNEPFNLLPFLEVGQEVWTIQDDWTWISNIITGPSYEIVTYSGGEYTRYGLNHRDDKFPSLFLDKPMIQIPTEKANRGFKKDEPVWCKFTPKADEWVLRYFSHQEGDRFFAFRNQKTSKQIHTVTEVFEVRKLENNPFKL